MKLVRYAVFLRGINVGGIKVPMVELRDLCTKIGAENIKTWLATGNIALDWRGNKKSLRDALEPALSERFHYKALVIVRHFAELADITNDCPFEPADTMHRYVVFFNSEQAATIFMSTVPKPNLPGEQTAQNGANIYWLCPKGNTTDSDFGKAQTKLAQSQRPTTRNLNTVEKMLH